MMGRTLPSLAVALAVAAGCGDPSSPGDAELGTYTLRTVNGSAPPALVGTREGVTVTALGGVLTLSPDRRFTSSLRTRVLSGQRSDTVTLVRDGTYTRRGDRVTLLIGSSNCNCEAGVQLLGAYANGSLTMTETGLTSLYTR